MSSRTQNHCGRVVALRSAAVAVLCTLVTVAAAQDRPAPKWELFGGYSFVYPGATVQGVLPGEFLPVSSRLESNPRGAGAGITYDFSRWFGLTLDASTHWGSGETGEAKRIDDAGFSNLSFGPKVTFRSDHFAPFVEALVGDQRLMPEIFHPVDKLGFMFGGGLDVRASRHVSLRLIRGDYVMSSYRYGPTTTTPSTDVRGVRLQAGIVLNFGGERPETPPTADCTVQPAEVFAGEPVTVTATGTGFRRTVVYAWSGSGVKRGESGASTQVDTTGLQPGPYEVTANLSDGTKHGLASCGARITVKAPRPPTISCASNPDSIPMGGTSAITSSAVSPDGRTLTYSYTTSAGNISGNTATATLDTAGAQPGTITVNCNVADDRNPPLIAAATTTVTLQAPPPPPPPQPDMVAIEKRLALHSVYFATAKPTVENPDAGLLPSQEQTLIALAGDFKAYLQSKPEAQLTLEGHADPRGSVEYNQALSERRVDRTKRFLVDQGIPAANIQTKAFGKQQNLTEAQVKEAVEANPELSPEDRQRVLHNMRTILLASNRRVDITLTNTGQAPQESVRQYPFNATDSLTLLKEEQTGKTATPGTGKRTHPKPRQ